MPKAAVTSVKYLSYPRDFPKWAIDTGSARGPAAEYLKRMARPSGLHELRSTYVQIELGTFPVFGIA